MLRYSRGDMEYAIQLYSTIVLWLDILKLGLNQLLRLRSKSSRIILCSFLYVTVSFTNVLLLSLFLFY